MEKNQKTSNLKNKESILSKIKNLNQLQLIRPALYVNSLIYFLIGIQHIIYPLMNKVIFIHHSFLIFLFLLFSLISFRLGKYYLRWRNVIINNLWLLINFGVAFVLYIFFSGILTPYINILTYILMGINALSLLINLENSMLSSFRRKIKNQQIYLKPNKSKVFSMILLILVIIGGVGSFMSWGITYTVKADEGFTTTSSYWGPPRNDMTSVVRTITPIDANTLLVHNSTLNESVDNFAEDSLCYVEFLYHDNGDTNYCNYTLGAMSYPNGTVILNEPLPDLNDLEIKFNYRYDISVFEDLRDTNATLIMNYLNSHDDFLEYSNIFMRIQRTYLFQLLDWWEIQYYLDVGIRELSYPTVFNYLDFVNRCNETIEWASIATIGEDGHKALTHMVGISLDFESSDKEVKEYNPLQNWNLQPPFIISYKEWIGSNEQNRTLYQEAIEAYEILYSRCSELGYKFYAVFQNSAMYDIMDGDLDTTRLPTFPISPNPNVLYGIMNYQDSNFDTGRYILYRESKNQITLYGEQGKTILLGWLSHNAKYYDNSSEGFDNYIQDCKIAQAAGIIEIFHAPLYRMQTMWGNDAIKRLHNELNEEEKQEFVINAPRIWTYNGDLMNDYVQNFDRLSFFIPILFIIVGLYVLELISIKKKKEIGEDN